MNTHSKSLTISPELEDDLRHLVRLAVREDLDRLFDLTTLSIVPAGGESQAAVVSRKSGLAAGFGLLHIIIDELDAPLQILESIEDGSPFQAGDTLARISGETRHLLTSERILLNFLGRLCGIATLTHEFAVSIAGTPARLYDTRKTTPGWRRLEKYAVLCGGGFNHRIGLFDAILIKDNHLACRTDLGGSSLSPSRAVLEARKFLQNEPKLADRSIPIQVEVDSIEQLRDALTVSPEMILLDNMSLEQLRQAVGLRNELAPQVELEASGGVNLQTITEIARTGVDRISVGALTHSAINLDLGLDWLPNPKTNS